jgi:hypothetical protein
MTKLPVSMRHFTRVLRGDWPRFAIELVVLVAGITISFAVDEWRREREDRRAERRMWEAIHEDLGTDSTYLVTRIAQLDGMVRAYDGLLQGGPSDSLDLFMDRNISYVVFTPTQGAYRELQQLAGSRLIRNRRLLAELTNAYNREYVRAAEWDAIGRNFVLDRMIPYLDETAPYVEGTGGGLVATGMAPVYRSVASRDRFRNLVRTHRLFKTAQKSVYEATLARVAALRAGTATELNRSTQ